jgi:tetratricopeptide (TPR) repeat protein
LFVARAQAAGGAAGTDAAVLAAIVRRLDGIPLAIELAAARTRLLGPAELATRLDAGLDVLGTHRGEGRHATLRHAIDWSWNLLSADEQRALARCSVLAGSFTLDAAAAIAGASLDVAASLRDKSLIHATGDGRLALYVSIREYAARRLLEAGEEEWASTHVHHARFFAALARHFNETSGLTSRVVESGLQERVRRDKENLAAALRATRAFPACAALEPELAMAVASLYAMPPEACVDSLTRALATRGTDRRAEAMLRLARQLVWRELGRHEESLRDLEALRSTPDVPTDLRAVALVSRGIQERYQGNPRAALATHEEAARELDALRPELRRASAMNDACLGRLHCDLRDGALARTLNGRAFAASEAIGDLWLSGLALANLAQLDQDEGRLEAAEARIAEAVSRLERAGEVHASAIYASVRGDILFERGKLAAARASYEAGARYFGPLLSHRQAGILHAAAAALEATAGHHDEAARHLEIAARSAELSENPVVRQVVAIHRRTVAIEGAVESERAARIASGRAWREAFTATAAESGSMDVRFALRVLARALTHGAAPVPTLQLASDGAWFACGDGAPVELGRRAALRRVLAALAAHHARAPGEGLGASALLAQGWPGERVLASAGETRVRVAISTLRSLGLRSMIVTRDDGYGLDARLAVTISPACRT